MNSTRYSVIITCYNQREFIRDAIDSALLQSVPEAEVIVIDDNSNDGSQQTLEAYGNAIQFVARSQNGGALRARNHGASLAQGEYLVFLDGDDALMPWALATYGRVIDEMRPTLILGHLRAFKGSLPEIESEPIPRRIELVEYPTTLAKDRRSVLSASTFVVDRQTFLDIGGWTPDIFHIDIPDLIMKLGSSGTFALIISPNTAFYRIHKNNSIHDVRSFVRNAHRMIERENMGIYPGGLKRRFQRHSRLGETIFYWVISAICKGMYKEGLGLALHGSSMILKATARRVAVLVHGRRPILTIGLTSTGSTQSGSTTVV